jgi:hypothetical protein
MSMGKTHYFRDLAQRVFYEEFVEIAQETLSLEELSEKIREAFEEIFEIPSKREEGIVQELLMKDVNWIDVAKDFEENICPLLEEE